MLLSFEDEGLAVVRQNMAALGTVTAVVGALRHHGIASSRFAADACQLLSLLVADEAMRQEALALELETFVQMLKNRHLDDDRVHRLADELQAGLRGIWHVRSATIQIPRPPLSMTELRMHHPFLFGRHHLDEDPDGPLRRKYGEPVTVKTTKGGPEIESFEDMVRQQEKGTAPPMVPYLHLDVPDDRPFYESCDHRPTDPDLAPPEEDGSADKDAPVLGLAHEPKAHARTKRAKGLAKASRAAIERQQMNRALPREEMLAPREWHSGSVGEEEEEDDDEQDGATELDEPVSLARRFDVQLLFYMLKYHKDRPDSLYVVFVVFTLALGAGPLPDWRLTQGKARRYGDHAGAVPSVPGDEESVQSASVGGGRQSDEEIEEQQDAPLVHDNVRLDDFEVQELPQIVHYLLRPLRHFASHPALPHYVCKSIAALARSAPLSMELGRQGAVTAMLTLAQGIEADVGRDTQQEALWALSELVRSPSNAGVLRQSSGAIVLRELAGRANAERMDRALFLSRLDKLQRKVLRPLIEATQATVRAVRAEQLRMGDAKVGRGTAVSTKELATITGAQETNGLRGGPITPAQAAYRAAEVASYVSKAAAKAVQTGPDRRVSVVPSSQRPSQLAVPPSESSDADDHVPESARTPSAATAVTPAPQDSPGAFFGGRMNDTGDFPGGNDTPPRLTVTVAKSHQAMLPETEDSGPDSGDLSCQEGAGALSPSIAGRGRSGHHTLSRPQTRGRSLNRVPGLATQMALHDMALRSAHSRKSGRMGTPRSLATPGGRSGGRSQSTARELLLSAREGEGMGGNDDDGIAQEAEEAQIAEELANETANPILEAVREDWNAAVREMGGDPLQTAAAATFVDQSTATFAPVVPKQTTVGWHAQSKPPVGVPPAPALVLPQIMWRLLDRWEKEGAQDD